MLRAVAAVFVISLGAATVAWRETPRPPRVVVVKLVDISPTEYRFQPSDVTVAPGDTVRFEQMTPMPHNVEFREVPAGTKLGPAQMGPFLTKAGEVYVLAIDSRFAPGLHRFVCTPHETLGMKGTLTVAAP
jgi:plastocyanin